VRTQTNMPMIRSSKGSFRHLWVLMGHVLPWASVSLELYVINAAFFLEVLKGNDHVEFCITSKL